ncbi:hypothetical protein OHA44_25255 [Streptomyces sp. NBC_00144]
MTDQAIPDSASVNGRRRSSYGNVEGGGRIEQPAVRDQLSP